MVRGRPPGPIQLPERKPCPPRPVPESQIAAAPGYSARLLRLAAPLQREPSQCRKRRHNREQTATDRVDTAFEITNELTPATLTVQLLSVSQGSTRQNVGKI